MTGYNDTDAWGRDPLDADYGKLPPNEAPKPPTSPSSSAQELADYVKGAIFVNARSIAVGFTMQRAVEIEAALRRLSETERERDALRGLLARLQALCADLWRDEMGALYDGDNGDVFNRALEAHAERDPKFKADYEAHRHRLSQKG